METTEKRNKYKKGQNEITEEEMEAMIRKMKKRKSPGEDKIPNEAWIVEKNEIIKELITNIHERREKGRKDYKGITLMDTRYKIYAEILRNRLDSELEEKEILNDTQMEFRDKRGTIDAIFVLKKAIQQKLKKRKRKIHTLFCRYESSIQQDKKEKNMGDIREKRDRRKIERNSNGNI